jgi:hypothetical protein
VRLGKSKCAALGRLLVIGCSSFDFAEALAYCFSFSVHLLSVGWSFRVTANDLRLKDVGAFEAQIIL